MQNKFSPMVQTFASAQNASSSYAYNANAFYALVPAFYRYFYEIDVRRWLWWYDGFVPTIHGNSTGIISTNIGRTIVDRAVEAVFTGGVMYGNADKPKLVDKDGVSISLVHISDRWAKKANFEDALKKVCKYAAAGGTGLLKLNQAANGALWIDTYRADRFFPILDASGKVESVRCVLTTYQRTGESGKTGEAYAIAEERYYKNLKWTKRVPVRRFSVYRVSSSTTDLMLAGSLPWESLPKPLKEFLRKNYAGIRIGEEQALPFNSLGCYAFRYTNGVERFNGVEMGESMLHPIMQYLLSYDYYFSSMNTDMYLGRGRVIAKKGMKNPRAEGQNFNAGLDSYMYEEVPSLTTEEQKPTPIQFNLRSAEWREIRNNLLESIAFAVGMSVGTLASFLNDTSNRTAREISAEENETRRFVEARRQQFEGPANECLKDVCLYLGLDDIVTVRWSLAGQTNIDTLSTRMISEHTAGLRSLKSCVQSINPDFDEHQVMEEMERIETEQNERAAGIFGDIGGGTEIV